MPRDIHALMKNTDDPDTKVGGDIKDHVRLVNQPSQSGRKFARIAAEHGILGNRIEAFTQTSQIGPRLLKSETIDREFVDFLKIGGRS